MDRAQEIRARLDAATPGPWSNNGGPKSADDTDEWFDRLTNSNGTTYQPVTAPMSETWIADVYASEPNAAFVAHAPADIAWLLDEVERLRGEA